MRAEGGRAADRKAVRRAHTPALGRLAGRLHSMAGRLQLREEGRHSCLISERFRRR
jgi:hypothetical protein